MTQRRIAEEPRRYWSDEDDALLRERFPTDPIADVAKVLNRTVSSTYQRAGKLGLKRPDTTEARFFMKVDKSGPKGCWLWLGATWGKGYGCIRQQWQLVAAHRFSWELHRGAIPDGLWVLHKCDNPPCVNPDHLFLGTCSDNAIDMVQKGRHYQQRRRAS